MDRLSYIKERDKRTRVYVDAETGEYLGEDPSVTIETEIEERKIPNSGQPDFAKIYTNMHIMYNLPPVCIAIYYYIVSHMDNQNRVQVDSFNYEEICYLLKISENWARKCVTTLVNKGFLLRVFTDASNTKFFRNLYVVNPYLSGKNTWVNLYKKRQQVPKQFQFKAEDGPALPPPSQGPHRPFQACLDFDQPTQ